MKSVKQFLSMAALGLGALVSQSALAQDVNINPGVTEQLQSIQQQVSQETMDFTNAELKASGGEMRTLGGDEPSFELPDEVKASIDNGIKSIGGDDLDRDFSDDVTTSADNELRTIGGDEPSFELPDEVRASADNELRTIGGDEAGFELPDEVTTSADNELRTIGGDGDDLDRDFSDEVTASADNEIRSIGGDEPGTTIDVGEIEVVEQVEVCDRKANEPSSWKYFTAIGMKGIAIVATLTSSGTLAPATYSVSKAADYLMKNGCDEIDLRKEVLDVTSTVVTAGAGPWVSMATDFALNKAVDKYDEMQKEEAEKLKQAKETQMAEAQAEPVIGEVPVVQTSQTVEGEKPLTKIDGYTERGVTPETDKPLTQIDGYSELGETAPVISLKFDRSAVEASRVSAENSPEPVKSKMRVLR